MTAAVSHAETLGRYVGAFVDELVAWGLEYVCICPGSRSTPLALAFARHPRIRVYTHLDERSCSYFALGMAKARPESPVAILCSSGTAAVNFAPAVNEAFHARVPLIVLTADRPQELRDLGANQTIDQTRLYGPAAKWSVEMPLPEATDEAIRYVRMVASRCVATSRAEPQGPVHLNFPFREPLTPAPYAYADPPQRLTNAATPLPERINLNGLADEIGGYERGVIVCGPNTSSPGEAIALARHLGLPLLADPLSGARNHTSYAPNVLGAYDAYLRPASMVSALAPDFVLRLGDPPTSKPLATYLARHRDARQIVVSPPGRWPDPDLTADEILYADPAPLCDALVAQTHAKQPGAWLAAWTGAEARSLGAINRIVGEEGRPTEPSTITDLAAVLPEGYAVFAGNSMPVRDIDSFFPAGAQPHVIYGNRGASGIDGVISTALGVAAVTEGRLVLVIGDLSFYHDMNGLLAAQRFGLSATIVLVNNDGGGIFSFLPQNSDQQHFEALFGTPHGLDFSSVASLYGVGFCRVSTREEYREVLKSSFHEQGVQIIEIKTGRNENLALHQRIWDEVAAAVQSGGSK